MNIPRTLTLLLMAVSAVSCAREILEPEHDIVGKWVLADGSDMSASYISFAEGGDVARFQSSSKVVFAENCFWNCSDKDFSKIRTDSYYILDGTVYLDGAEYGRVERNDCVLTVGGSTYSKLNSFKSEQYSSISTETNITVPYQGGKQTLDVTVVHPIGTGKLSVSGANDWISNLAVSESDRKLTFDVAENTKGATRCADLTLSYTGASDVVISVIQSGIPVQSITLNPISLSIKVDETSSISATVVPSDASLTWSSSDNNVATVDNNGKVKAVGAGTATITASSGGKTASCSVTVARLTPTFSISSNTLTCGVDGSAAITITSNSDCTFTASSDDTSVAVVSVSGKTVTVSGKAVGTANITVNCPQTSRYSAATSLYCSVTVKEISGTDLSSNGTANCYIVSKAGNYKFKATVKVGSTESVGTPASAVVLWESFGTSTAPLVGSIVNSVSLSSNYVTFATPSTLADGNAVIAVKDASDNILWSWHIWVCGGFDPKSSAQVYNNSAGTMMDRNLGATSATPGDVKALGLLYQWGRKDPFLSGCQISYSSYSDQQIAASTISWPSAVSSNSTTGTIAYAVAHPTTFITYNDSNYDWYYTGLSSTDNTRWRTSSSDKGIYDPCPPGWRVPDGGSSGVWSKAFGSSSYYSSGPWDSTNKGMNLGSGNGKSSSMQLGTSSTIWYPASGCRRNSDGSLYDVGNLGSYWSCTPYSYYAYYLDFRSNGYVSPSYYYYRAYGQGVRCLSE